MKSMSFMWPVKKAWMGIRPWRYKKPARRVITAWKKICDTFETAGIRSRGHVYIGEPIFEIEKAARDCRATMIVAGTSGKGEWRERWIGSIPKVTGRKVDLPDPVGAAR